MQFLLFDVSSTLVFLLGYLSVVALQRRGMLAMTMTGGGAPGTAPSAGSAAPVRPKERPAEQCCREWPRLSAPR